MKLSDLVRNKITGFHGIVTGKSEYINGCTQFLLSPTVSKDGEHRRGQWFDQTELENVKENATDVGSGTVPSVGGPMRDAPPAA